VLSPSSPERDAGSAGGIYRWYVVALLGTLYFVAFADRLALSLLIQPIERDLRISDSAVGLLFGLSFAATLAVISIPLGRLADSRNRRNLIAVSVAVWSLMTALSGLARNFGALLVCRIGVAVGEAGLSPAALSMIADLFPTSQRGLPVGVYLTAGIAGATGSFVVLGAVVHAVTSAAPIHLPGFGDLAPWRTTLILIGLPTTALAILLRLSVREPAREPRHRPGPISEVVGFFRANAREHLGFFAAGALMALLSISATAWYPTFLIRERGLTAPQVGYLFGAVSIVAGISGSLLVPAAANAVAARRSGGLRLAALVAVAIGAPCFALGASVHQLSASLALMGVAQFCFIGGINIPTLAIQQTAPSQLRAQMTAVYFLAVNLGGLGTGPMLTAQLAKLVFGGARGLGPALESLAIVAGPVALVALLSLPRASRAVA
jgi:predicted MFS family arabinose efflux permease